MVSRDKEGMNSPAPSSIKTPTHPYNWDNVDLGSTDSDDNLEAGNSLGNLTFHCSFVYFSLLWL